MIPASNARESTLGQGMLWLAAIGLLLGFTWLFQGLIPGTGKMLSGEDEQGRAMIILQQDRSGHYLADGLVNERPVRFLVDTGATDVALSESAARALGIEFGPRIRVQTAAGPVGAWLARLDSVAVGGLRLENVRATITPGLGEQALLGMSFLKNFTIRQQDGRLVITAEENRQ